MRRLGAFLHRHRRAVVVLAFSMLLPIAFLAAKTPARLQTGGFVDESSESARATAFVAEEFGSAANTAAILVTATTGDVDDPDVVADAGRLVADLDDTPHVDSVLSYWDAPLPDSPLRGIDGRQALVIAELMAADEAQAEEASEALAVEFNGSLGTIEVVVGGRAETQRLITEQVESDLGRSELITVPIVIVALVGVFGGLIAAGLPLVVGLFAVLITLVLLYVFTGFTFVSVFALNLTTAMGLGLAIDYSLFVVSRFREEIAGGRSTRLSVMRTMQTAGRTVAFSAATVAVSLVGLLIFPSPYLRSFAYAGVGVVVAAAAASLIVLPALLAMLGPKVDMWPVIRRSPPTADGFWSRQARRVMRNALPVALLLIAGLGALAIPFFGFTAGLADDRVLPEGHDGRAVTDALRDNFATRETSALSIALPNPGVTDTEVDALAESIVEFEAIGRVDARTGIYRPGGEHIPAELIPTDTLDLSRFDGDAGTWLSAVPSVEPFSSEGQAVVGEIRGLSPEFGSLSVGGLSAELVDTTSLVKSRLPWMLAVIGLATFVLLFMMTGSLLVPAKALVLNTLSLTATFGAIVWVFQDGNLSDALNFTATGSTDVLTPILMFCVAFGLSMDYEVFVLSRIKEEYDLSRDNDDAVAVGLQKTGGIVTAAALLLAISFFGTSMSEISLVKMLGLGLTLAVLVDAFIVRATLVPALMKLAGDANWWAPRALRRFHLRYGIFEEEPIEILDVAETKR